MLGVAYILYFEIQQLQTDRAAWAVALGLFSAITYATVVLFIRHLRHVDTAWIVVVNQSMTVLCLLPWVIAWGIVPSGSQWLWLALFGALQMALPYLLFSWALKHVPGAEATLLTLVEPILVPVWAFLTRGEEPKAWTIHGAGIILLGLLLRYGLEMYEQRTGKSKLVNETLVIVHLQPDPRLRFGLVTAFLFLRMRIRYRRQLHQRFVVDHDLLIGASTATGSATG